MTDPASTDSSPPSFLPKDSPHSAEARVPEIHRDQGRTVYYFGDSQPILEKLGFLSGKPSAPATEHLPGRTQHPVYSISNSEKYMWKLCRRGGFLSRFNRKTYFSTRRFVEELILSDRLHRSGIPSSRVLAFSATRMGLGFEVAQIIQLEENVVSISDLLGIEKSPPARPQVRSTGELIHRFHSAGFLHGDLNLMNIMVNADPSAPVKSLLVDLDPGSVPPGANRTGNLARLARSYAKIIDKGGTRLTAGDRFRFLYCATGGDRTLLKAALKQCLPHLPERERSR